MYIGICISISKYYFLIATDNYPNYNVQVCLLSSTEICSEDKNCTHAHLQRRDRMNEFLQGVDLQSQNPDMGCL